MKLKIAALALALLSVFLALPVHAQSFPTSNLSLSYQLLRSTTCNTSGCQPLSPTQNINTSIAIGWYKLSWTVQGTVASCTTNVDSNDSGLGSWTTGGIIGTANIPCTAKGSYTIPAAIFVNLVRITPSVTCTGTCNVTFTLLGFINQPPATGSGT